MEKQLTEQEQATLRTYPAAMMGSGYAEVARWTIELLHQMQGQMAVVEAARADWVDAARLKMDTAKVTADFRADLDAMEANILIEARADGRINGKNEAERANQITQLLRQLSNDDESEYGITYRTWQECQREADVAKLDEQIKQAKAEDACRILHGIEESLHAIAGLR